MATNSRGGPGRPVIVVGVDGSATARRAADRAAEIAASIGARLHLVSAVKVSPSREVRGPGGDTWYLDDLGETETQLEDMARNWPDLAVSTAGADGKPADVIVKEAERVGAEIIVVGNRRMQGIGRILGSVASEVAHNAPCDVLIVKTVD